MTNTPYFIYKPKHSAKMLAVFVVSFLMLSFTPAKNQFTAAEQQQISIATPGLFDRSSAFNVDFDTFRDKEYAFPLPVGKVQGVASGVMKITTKKGDAVKAMFDGHVRLSRKTDGQGNVIVIRHDNGLETVYANNAENLVKVGQHVEAGQTIAIVGSKGGEVYLDFSIMVNGGRINPETILEPNSHKLRRQTVQFRKNGSRVNVSVIGAKNSASAKNNPFTLNPDEESQTYQEQGTVKLDLEKLASSHWAYPLPGCKVISPYGGKRRHSGVDLKTKPNDDIVAAFDGEVVSSGPFAGYGNCIRIRHAYGFETLYSHQSKNLVKKGDKVKAGQVIGLTGRTGRATTEHLHFEISCNGHRLNPAEVFDHQDHTLQKSTVTVQKGSRPKFNKNK